MSGDQHQASNSMGSRILSGLAWKAGSQMTLQLSRMVVALFMARLLAPHDWGLAAMVLVISGFVVVFTDSALGTALIQRPKLLEEDRSTVFWTNSAVGLLLMIGGIALAGPVANFYGEPAVRPLFAALSIGFFVSALGATHSALLVRDMHFRVLELRQIAATVVGAVAGISIALMHYGAWAIIGQQLAEATVSTILLWYLSSWHPSLTFSTASLHRLGGFAGNVFGENLLYQAGRNLSSVLIGRFLGPAATGTYALSTNVILVPFSRIAGPLQQVFFPAFSRLNDDLARLADTWIRATRLVASISLPALVGLVIVAPDFVDVVLGPRWHEAVPVIQILAWVGLIQSVQTLNGEVLLAVNRAGTLLRFTMLSFAGSVVAFFVGLQWGVVGVAAAYAVATVLIEPVRTWSTTRAVRIPLLRFFSALFGIAQATALMGVVVIASRSLLISAGISTGLRLALLIAIGCATYVPCCWWRAPEVRNEIQRVIGRSRRSATSRVEVRDSRVLEH